ncbi:hypothetical protein D910_06149 [Dendroctonus ponderosae]|uniref:Uncharacterized protein n=2 Tax=Dendroctonus ponderosae TaxID=77166 RepID=U4U6S2_DENPD|nr:hypothetical protein D910_06149 [Dendroctonus ponderosae]
MNKLWKYVASSVFIGSVTYGLIKYFRGGVCTCSKTLHGLGPVIITGGNSDIGKALAIELGLRGGTLILACRDLKKGAKAKLEIAKAVNRPSLRVFVKHLDFCSFQSIRSFADTIEKEFPQIYALVNCAGVFYHPQQLTDDRYDVTFQTNYLGPFVLTHYLLDHLKKQNCCRVVNVSSEAHRKVRVNDLLAILHDQSELRSHLVAYGVSKLLLNFFTIDLGRSMRFSRNKGLLINVADPGYTETKLYRNYSNPELQEHSNSWLFPLQKLFRQLARKTPQEGLATLPPCQYMEGEANRSMVLQIGGSFGYIIRKETLIAGRWGAKPYEGSGVRLNIAEGPLELMVFDGKSLIIGEIGGPFGSLVDACVCSMHLSEKAHFRVEMTPEEIDLTIELVELDFGGFIHQWDAAKKFDMAVKRKELGKQLFQENLLTEAANRFSKAFRVLCSIPISVETPLDCIDSVNVSDIQLLKETLYNNMSACYFRHQNFDSVIPLCQKVLALNPCNVKALFKIGVAYEHERDFEKAHQALSTVLEIEPNNKAAADHLETVKVQLRQVNFRLNSMMKKMISGTIGK